MSPDEKHFARTRSTGVTFEPPVTHDMVRSLFDPTVRKSFLEICISLALLSNFGLCYWLLQRCELKTVKMVFLFQYMFWRIGYNLGIGTVLHFQSHWESLTNFARRNKLFQKGNKTVLAKLCQFELFTKMSKEYKMYEKPEELNVWLLFRQFVDLILMQDFCTYMIYVYLSLPQEKSALVNWKTAVGISMVMFNIWVKIDAHRVVKDYAWYWGDFFFLQDSELVFDGVFNISPHPMYSIGYLGYYGLSLICGDYRVLLVSMCGHYMQYLFLKYVESPHIERTYGSESNAESDTNCKIDDLIAKKNYNYSRPLINTGFGFANFDILRFSDYFTIATSVCLVLWTVFIKPSDQLLFNLTFGAKAFSSIGVSIILYKQSKEKWFTKLYLKNGHTQVHSYQQWQFIYNFSLCLTYTLLGCQTFSKVRDLYPNVDNTQLIFGLLLCSLQSWCNSEIRSAIYDFGWFYGDFFLTNYVTKRTLTSHGIYRYLNNPEAILGVAGVWGTVLMTNFYWENIALAALWTVTNFILVKFIEQPHMSKIYGAKMRIGGIEKTLLESKTWRRVSGIVDKIEEVVIRALLQDIGDEKESALSNNVLDEEVDQKAELQNLEDAMEDAFHNVTSQRSASCTLEIESYGTGSFVVGQPITLNWSVPSSSYKSDDWVGLYNILRSGSDRRRTKSSSLGHWSATSPTGYPQDTLNTKSITYFKRGSLVEGKIVFDSSLLFFEPGIYEFRYHSGNSHKVLSVSKPFEQVLPKLSIDSPEILCEYLLKFLAQVDAVTDSRFDPQRNRNFTITHFKKLIKESLGVELSSDYISRVKGDLHVISSRICHIKEVLDSLE
ncbi:hypothetical protein HG537_0D02520 [Torulaspora globosa]|uniref:Phosphatidylethanolamine N-methyltransferase n=1 Tax=Torulaspora globosa TaxID=48254 RepID=A0A7H9HSG2_9SACH|nr:hypothetical protein HG537_0D02520 [Torulaspora sp. CBS 2947]